MKCSYCDKESVGCDDRNFGADYCEDHHEKAREDLDKYWKMIEEASKEQV